MEISLAIPRSPPQHRSWTPPSASPASSRRGLTDLHPDLEPDPDLRSERRIRSRHQVAGEVQDRGSSDGSLNLDVEGPRRVRTKESRKGRDPDPSLGGEEGRARDDGQGESRAQRESKGRRRRKDKHPTREDPGAVVEEVEKTAPGAQSRSRPSAEAGGRRKTTADRKSKSLEHLALLDMELYKNTSPAGRAKSSDRLEVSVAGVERGTGRAKPVDSKPEAKAARGKKGSAAGLSSGKKVGSMQDVVGPPMDESPRRHQGEPSAVKSVISSAHAPPFDSTAAARESTPSQQPALGKEPTGTAESVRERPSPARQTRSTTSAERSRESPAKQDGRADGAGQTVAAEASGYAVEDEDLNPETHQLTDFKELCKSVASLLHIEDQAAAAMLTQPLSGRRDLVEGLDAEAIVDYLAQHGVLDLDMLSVLRSTSQVAKRNKMLLKHVEREGHTAVALFINALRQSGQLHLASSLDNTQRIRLPSEGGYLEKQRHKGEVTIIIKVKTLLLVVPERDTEGDVIDASMLASPRKDSQGMHKSYENVLLFDEEHSSSGKRLAQYVYDHEDEDASQKKNFFCFCIPLRRKKQKGREEKYKSQRDQQAGREINGKAAAHSPVVVTSPPLSGGSKSGGGRESEKVLSGDANKNGLSVSREFRAERTSPGIEPTTGSGRSGRKGIKENTDPVIMEYNRELELVRLKTQTHSSDSPTSSSIIMCEKWKSGGQHFRKKVAALCEKFESELQTHFIKYFEQDRGTLVLSMWTDQRTMHVVNICMKAEQVQQLHRDYNSKALAQKLESLLRSSQTLEQLQIKDMELDVSVDEPQFTQALQEL